MSVVKILVNTHRIKHRSVIFWVLMQPVMATTQKSAVLSYFAGGKPEIRQNKAQFRHL
jgi:hypothetical protein